VEQPKLAPDRCAPAASLLARLGRWAVGQFRSSLRPVGLKPRHLATLLELREAPRTQQALAEAVGTDAAQLVGLLNDLESEGLVLRRRDQSDRRRHIVEISERGRARVDEADRAVRSVEERLLAGLDSAQRSQLIELLGHVAEHGAYDEACEGKTELVLPCDSALEEPPCEGSR
jgi:DNA-binding MarR family transcriptional regulator